jgi:hypothetical protein
MADKVFKSPLDQSKSWQSEFSDRVSKNPAYSKMAQYARGDNQDVADDYFYAFKDAYEQSPDYNKYGLMMEDDIGARLSDRYYKLLDDDYAAHGITPDGSYENDLKYERQYLPEFERKYGTHDDFLSKTKNGWRKWMQENYGGESEDHQTFGHYIRNNPDKFKSVKELDDYYNDWAGPGVDSYKDLYNWWHQKLGFGGK